MSLIVVVVVVVVVPWRRRVKRWENSEFLLFERDQL